MDEIKTNSFLETLSTLLNTPTNVTDKDKELINKNDKRLNTMRSFGVDVVVGEKKNILKTIQQQSS